MQRPPVGPQFDILGGMTSQGLPRTFTPMEWMLSHPGTNGYVSSWGAMLSGTTPTFVAA